MVILKQSSHWVIMLRCSIDKESQDPTVVSCTADINPNYPMVEVESETYV